MCTMKCIVNTCCDIDLQCNCWNQGTKVPNTWLLCMHNGVQVVSRTKPHLEPQGQVTEKDDIIKQGKHADNLGTVVVSNHICQLGIVQAAA